MQFSVIIPVYNCEKTLHISVESILAQTFEDWELILVNDGSRDNSLAICNEYAKKDSRIKVINQENAGAGPARNNGIKVSIGEYLVFCDADDFYEKTALESFNKAIVISGEPDLIISSYKEFKFAGENNAIICGERIAKDCHLLELKEIREKYVEFHKSSFITAPWAKAYRRELVLAYKIGFADLRRCQDVVFNLEFYDVVRSVSVISDYTYCYQTPDADSYLRKFPITMFEIQKKVYSIILEKLNEWKVLTEQTKQYFNCRFIKDASILLRLNYQNNWRLSTKDQREFATTILNDKLLISIERMPVTGIMNKVIRMVLLSKNIYIINLFSKGTVWYQKICVRSKSL